MKLNQLLFFSVLLFLIQNNAEAQIWKNAGKKIGKKIEQKADQRLEKKVDKAIDKTLDEVEEAPNAASKPKNEEASETPNASASTPNLQGLGAIGMVEVNLPSSYQFDVGVTYTTQEGKKKSNEMTIWYSNKPFMATEIENNIFSVMDINQKAMISFMQESNMYMAISTDFSSFVTNTDQKIEDNDQNATIEKVGTENILGYNCDKYKFTSDDTEGYIWYTNELKVNYSNFFMAFAQTFQKGKNKNQDNFNGMPYGVMMKMESIDKKSKKTSSFIATTVHANGKKFNTSGYTPLSY